MDTGSVPQHPYDVVRVAVSGGGLEAIFNPTVEARLLKTWEEARDTTVGWVYEGEAENFKAQERVNFGPSVSLKKLGRGESADHASFGDSVEYLKIARYSQQFVIDEMDIINNRVEKLIAPPEELGRASKRVRPDLVYALLLRNPTLAADETAVFHVNHGNLGTTSTALSSATLNAAMLAIARQSVARGGETINLNLRGRFLLTPPDLEFVAAAVLNSVQSRVVVGDSGGAYDPLRDQQIELRSDGRLGEDGVKDPDTGESFQGTATNWFLAADPAGGRTIEVAYLKGSNRMPELRSFALEHGQYGVGWEIALDIGAKILDYGGLYKATGAS